MHTDVPVCFRTGGSILSLKFKWLFIILFCRMLPQYGSSGIYSRDRDTLALYIFQMQKIIPQYFPDFSVNCRNISQ